jgi:hypothetical protein
MELFYKRIRYKAVPYEREINMSKGWLVDE